MASGAAVLVTAMRVTSLGSRLARAHAAAIRPLTSSSFSAKGVFLTTRRLLPRVQLSGRGIIGASRVDRKMKAMADDPRFKAAIERFDALNARDPAGKELV